MEHYVYAHLEDGEPVYIGIGKGGRAYACGSRESRESSHNSWMQNKILDGSDFVQIIASRITSEEARSLEKQLVSKLNPKFNVRDTKRIKDSFKAHSERLKKPVITPDGEFSSVSEAAKFYNISQAAMSKRIKTNDAYQTR